MARPTKYRDTYPQIAAALCRKGYTDEGLAEVLGVTRDCVARWKTRYPEFAEAVKWSKDAANAAVEAALFQKATIGSRWNETVAIKCKHVRYDPQTGKKISEDESVEVVKIEKGSPPEATAQIFWLTNRSNGEWKHRQQFEHLGTVGLKFDVDEPEAPDVGTPD